MTVFAVILAFVVLSGFTGCTTTREIVVPKVVERKPIEVPKSLLACSPEPKMTADLIALLRARGDSGTDISIFINHLATAGADCRAKLAAVRRLLETQS